MQARVVLRFTEAEARAKLGQRVRAEVEFAGVPKGTEGTVVDVHEFETGQFDVIVEWQSPLQRNLRDRFAKEPYEEYLSELLELAIAV
ncbi:MAG TPA: hypothetical protein VNG71_01670 [Pyrinomonadaceae bacterium]|nr:hypothetical protein [Pyrinomonadaceae bacterium]